MDEEGPTKRKQLSLNYVSKQQVIHTQFDSAMPIQAGEGGN
jgi:hypothetical protein